MNASGAMDCNKYRSLAATFAGLVSAEVAASDEYEDWREHRSTCAACGDWQLRRDLEDRGIDVDDFPCVHVAYHSTMPCDVHESAWDCPDITLVRAGSSFGIPVRDGGTSYIELRFCPWCGIALAKENEE